MSKKSIFYTTADLNYSDVSPTLDLNFVENQKVPPFVNVTRNSQTTYVDKFGILRTADINQPVFEWDPITGKCLGARIWGAVINGLLQSNSIGVSPWGTNNAGSVTYTSNAALSPAGVVNARRITATADFAGPNQFASVTSGTTYTVSFFVKAVTIGSLDELRLELFGYQLRFKISTQAFFQVNVNFTAYGAINYGNGWYRLYASAAAPSTGSLAGSLYAYQSADLYAWGAQLNTGPLAPYVPTTTTAASSTADAWSITGADFTKIWNTSAGTMYFDGSFVQTGAGNYPRLITAVGANPGTDEISVYTRNGIGNGDGRFLGNSCVSGTDVFTLGDPASPRANSGKAAFTFTANDAALYDGVILTTDNTGSLPTVQELRIMGQARFQNQPVGYIRRLTIYPKRLTNSQLVQLTE